MSPLIDTVGLRVNSHGFAAGSTHIPLKDGENSVHLLGTPGDGGGGGAPRPRIPPEGIDGDQRVIRRAVPTMKATPRNPARSRSTFKKLSASLLKWNTWVVSQIIRMNEMITTANPSA